MGLELIATWTVLKGLPVPERVRVSEVYILSLEPMEPHKPQFSSLADPVAIPSGGLFRFQLWLEHYHQSVQNEALVRLVTEFDGKLWRSAIVYLGRY